MERSVAYADSHMGRCYVNGNCSFRCLCDVDRAPDSLYILDDGSISNGRTRPQDDDSDEYGNAE